VVEALCGWALADGRRTVLEPACGDGAFLRALAGKGVRATGIERDGREATRARKAAPRAEVVRADFLDWADAALDEERTFDAVVGNPPFIRYQYLDDATQAKIERLYDRLGAKFTRHTNAWVPFLLAGLRLLRPGGRLAMVIPAELAHVLHAQVARDALVDSCTHVELIEPADTFAGTLQGIVLVRAERGPGPATLRLDGADVSGASLAGAKWTAGWLRPAERALLADLTARGAAVRFSDIADVCVGIVTGANSFFLVPDATVAAYDLAPFTAPMFGRSDHVDGAIFDERDHAANRALGLPSHFVHLGDTPRARLPAGARRYLAHGESLGLHRRYKCRIRDPWWSVPSVHAAPVAMLKRSHDFPRLVLNQLGAFTTDTAYRVTPRTWPADRLVSSFASSLTALSAELEGRHYGGGVLELVPSEIARLLLASRTPAPLADLDTALRASTPAPDLLLARDAALGLPRALHDAWLRLRARRQRH
jgi:tRNA1(Val) A37 N6-methylase TrmN6